MTHQLESTFRDLGLSQYLGTFVDQGFDTWDTILDIQESDLDALGVKLGHRRKLQRRIANARGVAPSTQLPSSKQNPEEAKHDGPRPSPTRTLPLNNDGSGVVKRKYRRHPKPDENAPERPPSAYVLFSNKMREDLKGQNLTFTEIAKLVGENWQSLPPAEREVYEKQANAAKEEYHRQLSEYKKTPEYRKHAQYLVEFKEKQAKRDQDANKRSKIDPSRFRHESSSGSMGGSASSASSGGSTSTNGSVNHSLRNSRSSSERMPEPEPHHTRDRMGSISSIADSHKSMSPIMADAKFSPRTAKPADRGPRMTSSIPVRDGNIGIENGRQHLLPSLSDVLDSGLGKSSTPTAPDGGHYARPGMVPAGVSPVVAHPASMVDGNRSRHPMPPRPGGLPPMLHHEESSNGSSMSGASGSPSTAIFGRSPVEGSLPIHALLENRPTQGTLPTPNHMVAADRTVPALGPRGYGFQSASSALQHMKVEESTDDDVVMTSPALEAAPPPIPTKSGAVAVQPPPKAARNGLDGMSALLRAGEIVDGSRND